MEKVKKIKDYQLRYAAGRYFLLNMQQKGFPYEIPKILNESGATIWKMLECGKTKEEVAMYFKTKYEITFEQALQDVEDFMTQLGLQ